MSSRLVAFIFEFGNDSCTADDGIMCVNGALHAEGSTTAYELKLLDRPAFRALTARCASAHSQINVDRRRYAACMSAFRSARPLAHMFMAGMHASEVGGGVQ